VTQRSQKTNNVALVVLLGVVGIICAVAIPPLAIPVAVMAIFALILTVYSKRSAEGDRDISLPERLSVKCRGSMDERSTSAGSVSRRLFTKADESA